MESYELNVNPDGKVNIKPILSEQEQNSKLDQIIELINDPDSPLAPIKRLIAAEIANTSRTILHYGNDLSLLEGMKIKALETQVKALRELGKELMESDVLSKKDFLNFDGPRLAYVLQEYRQGAQDTLTKIGIDEATIQSFLRHWRDLMLEREHNIRKTADKLDFTVTETK